MLILLREFHVSTLGGMKTEKRGMRRLLASLMAVSFLTSAGCWTSTGPEVVVYSALDREFSEPLLKDFQKEAGIAVQPVYDDESSKTVGLTNRILREADRPRCDLFWNNEILNTLRLQKAGLADVYRTPAAEPFPPMARSAKGTWHGFAARARVLIVNTDRVAEAEQPTSILDLADPKWKGRCGIAKPLFGTTASHAACLFAHWGDDRAKDFFRKLKENDCKILSGNKQVARSVAGGQIDFGLTDTDDAVIERDQGRPVAIVYPDQGEGQPGTLFIPNTLVVVRGGPHPEAARRLVDWLLRPEVEARLATGPSAQIPLNPDCQVEVRVATPQTVRPMPVDFEAAAEKWDTAAEFLRDEFTGS